MDQVSRARWILAGLTTFAYLIVFLLIWVADLKIKNLGTVSQGVVFVTAIMVISRMVVKEPRLRAASETLFYGLLLVPAIIAASYLSVRMNMPWADDELQAMDRALGVDWVAILAFADARKYLSIALNIAYASFGLQLMALPLILALIGSTLRSYLMITVYAVACFISAIISIWYPALGTYAAYNIDPSQLENINGHMGVVFLDQLRAAHDNADFALDFNHLEGVITFPSVHAAMAVLCAWAAWETKWLRYPFLILNTLMVVSAGIVSNHYVVDLIAGMGIAGFSIALVLCVVGSGKTEFDSAVFRLLFQSADRTRSEARLSDRGSI